MVAAVVNLRPGETRPCLLVTDESTTRRRGGYSAGSLGGRAILSPGSLVAADGIIEPGGTAGLTGAHRSGVAEGADDIVCARVTGCAGGSGG